jgi:hypothetical protein
MALRLRRARTTVHGGRPTSGRALPDAPEFQPVGRRRFAVAPRGRDLFRLARKNHTRVAATRVLRARSRDLGTDPLFFQSPAPSPPTDRCRSSVLGTDPLFFHAPLPGFGDRPLFFQSPAPPISQPAPLPGFGDRPPFFQSPAPPIGQAAHGPGFVARFWGQTPF